MTHEKFDLEETASRLLADYDAVQPESLFKEGFRLDLTDAWRVQTELQLRECGRPEVNVLSVTKLEP